MEMKKTIILILFVFCCVLLRSQTITVERISSTDDCIMGYLLVDDEVVCYSLELPWRENLPNVSSIPKGEYEGFVRTDGNK